MKDYFEEWKLSLSEYHYLHHIPDEMSGDELDTPDIDDNPAIRHAVARLLQY